MAEFSKELRAQFNPKGELYELRHELARVMNSEEWKGYSKVSQKFDAKRRYAERAFELDYPSRFAAAQKQLIDEAGSIKRRFTPKFFGADDFNKGQIDRRAKAVVVDGHKKNMAQIDQQETEVLRSMLGNSQARTAQREKPIKDFQKAVDRRSGHERRQISRGD